MLRPDYAPHFNRDVKRLKKQRRNLDELKHVMNLVIEHTEESRAELRRRHGEHLLAGNWRGHHECHVCNAGDWLLIWAENDEAALFERTGSHDDLFGRR